MRMMRRLASCQQDPEVPPGAGSARSRVPGPWPSALAAAPEAPSQALVREAAPLRNPVVDGKRRAG